MPKGSNVVDPLSGSTKNKPSPVSARAVSVDVEASGGGVELGWVQAARERARLAARMGRRGKGIEAMVRSKILGK